MQNQDSKLSSMVMLTFLKHFCMAMVKKSIFIKKKNYIFKQ